MHGKATPAPKDYGATHDPIQDLRAEVTNFRKQISSHENVTTLQGILLLVMAAQLGFYIFTFSEMSRTNHGLFSRINEELVTVEKNFQTVHADLDAVHTKFNAVDVDLKTVDANFKTLGTQVAVFPAGLSGSIN